MFVPWWQSKPGCVQLEVGTVGEVVEVRAASENLVNTQDLRWENNFISQQITQLPLKAAT